MKPQKEKEILYTEIKPQSELNPFIKSFWHYENNTNEVCEYSILPDGCFDFLAFSDGKTQLTGLWSKSIDVSMAKGIKIFAIRFKPLAVEYLIEDSIKDILNSLLQNPKNEFLENMKTKTEDFSEFVKVNSPKIISVLESKNITDARKKKVFELLFKTKGNISIKEISEKSFWSSRQINRYFNSYFGLSTKQYANILKVFSTYRDLSKGTLYPQTDYFDQPHFIREIKRHTGKTPKELSENKNDRFLQLSTQQSK